MTTRVEVQEADVELAQPRGRRRRAKSTGRKSGQAMDYRLADVAALDEDFDRARRIREIWGDQE